MLRNRVNKVIDDRISHHSLHNEPCKDSKIDELKILKLILRDRLG